MVWDGSPGPIFSFLSYPRPYDYDEFFFVFFFFFFYCVVFSFFDVSCGLMTPFRWNSAFGYASYFSSSLANPHFFWKMIVPSLFVASSYAEVASTPQEIRAFFPIFGSPSWECLFCLSSSHPR